MPEVYEAQYLLDMLSEVGEAKWNGEKLVAIDWKDLNAWVQVTGSDITPEEAIVLRHLSGVYINQHYDSLETGCIAPHMTAPQNRVVIEDKMKSLFAMLRGNK